MKPALEIQAISKKYRIQASQGPYLSVRDSLGSIFKKGNDSPFSFWGGAKTKAEDFYALTDVSFDVQAGDAIGVIGRNGAGKSTLLKVISKITPPSKGKIIVRGRVASLLEVGTGFHAELTGRENVFLNGSILGMRKREIVSKFDEIVDFSGVEKFIDTPLKHYSSGMQLRLAFAVAAFLEPEILLIDEVLAVGDAEFQKKCLGKMDEVHKSGRTVLFVSHNMTAVKALCDKCVSLKDGRVQAYDETEKIINQYLKSATEESTEYRVRENEKHPGDDVAILHSARIIDENHEVIEYAYLHNKVGIELTYEVIKPGAQPIPNIHIYRATGECAFVGIASSDPVFTHQGHIKTVMWIPENLLNEGMYTVGVAVSTINPLIVHFFVPDAMMFETFEEMNRRVTDYQQPIPGVLRPDLKWESEHVDGASA